MIDLKLDSNNDLALEVFDLVYLTQAEQVAQRVKMKLLTFKGEVDLNTDFGVPWFDDILGVKPVNINRVDAILREQILTTPEMVSLESFVMDYDENTRQLSLTFTGVSIYGPIGGTVILPEV